MLWTAEQRAIVDAMCHPDTNAVSTCCIVNAFGGCGKTQVLHEIVQTRFAKGYGCALFLTFSSRLKNNLKRETANMEGYVVENVHSLIRNELHRGSTCFNDEHVASYVAMSVKPQLHSAFQKNVSLVIFDELQDMNALHFQVIETLRTLMLPKIVSFIGVGDVFQLVCAQRIQSDLGYLTDAKHRFQHERFLSFALRGSFRMNQPICDWINTNLSPATIERHFPKCWSTYGAVITSHWGNGMFSHKCNTCHALHDQQSPCVPHNQPMIQLLDNAKRMDAQLLTPSADRFVKDHNALVLVNGRNTKAYNKIYPFVSTPFAFKGQEAESVVVVGFDQFTERLCAQGKTDDDVHWPFILYCQMYVCITRAATNLCVLYSAKTPFYTMRQPTDSMYILPTKKQDCDTQYTTITAVVASVTQKTDLDILESYIDTRTTSTNVDYTMIPTDDECNSMRELPNSTLQYLQTLFVMTAYDMVTNNIRIKNWSVFLQNNIRRRFKLKTTPVLHPNIGIWFGKQMCWFLDVTKTADFNRELGPNEAFQCGKLCGTIPFMLRFGCLFVQFDANPTSTIEHMASFACCKARSEQLKLPMLFFNCDVVNLCTHQTLSLQLTDIHPDFYLTQLVTMSHHTHCLDPNIYNLSVFVEKGFAIPNWMATRVFDSKKRRIDT